MDNNALNDFLNSFVEKSYPEDFLKKYEPMECLANTPMGETLLVKDRLNTFYIAKCYTDPSVLSKTTENELLKKLHHDGLPAFVEEYKCDDMLCVVRQYAKGVPLNLIVKPLSETRAVSVIMQLCDILSYLHTQTPPVIHRDIKPQNIILCDNDKVMLIDFGISRIYDENARADTVFFGTQEFAPPEQYGFSQTDSRADIFSLGVVLAWLLSGKTRIDGFTYKNKQLERIVRKCTAFAPKDRYRDAKAVKRALGNADGHRQKKVIKACCAAAVLIAALAAGFALGRFTDVRPALFYNNAYVTFSEPLVEKAVRLQLGKTNGEPIKTEELDEVRELYLYADQAAKTQEEFYPVRSQVDSGEIAVSGETITSLEDISKLKNLERLSLGHERFEDISPLAALTRLEALEIYGCPIDSIETIQAFSRLYHFTLQQCEVTDLTPIASCPDISELILCDLDTKDFSALATLGDIGYLHLINVDAKSCLQHLKGKTVGQLKICGASLASAESLGGINVEELIMEDVSLNSLSGIEKLTGLTKVTIKNMPRLGLAPLKALPVLETLTLNEDMREAAADIEGEDFKIKYE